MQIVCPSPPPPGGGEGESLARWRECLKENFFACHNHSVGKHFLFSTDRLSLKQLKMLRYSIQVTTDTTYMVLYVEFYLYLSGTQSQSWVDANVFASSRPRRESILTTRNAKTRHAKTGHRREISRHWRQ